MQPAGDSQQWSDNNMTISALDARPALLVVDLQKGIVGLATAHPMADVVSHAARLAEAFRHHDLPVVLSNVDGGAPGRTEQSRRVSEFPAGWTDLIPELNRQPGDYLVTKRTWGAFTTGSPASRRW
jgi:nicotinamidase-related amidase